MLQLEDETCCGKALNFVRVVTAGVQLGDGRQLEADLVVDASGRNSQTPAWLGAAGFEQPPEVGVQPLLQPRASCGTPACCRLHASGAVAAVSTAEMLNGCSAVGRATAAGPRQDLCSS
jgi:2-polyprenyl-6-methoxyphenol hydroxylase-like FAD-dependent oxidoreductase